ncbi:MAG: hypothetical protein ABEK17_02700 [Candidatus Aenigmatarchaeota archaeon]
MDYVNGLKKMTVGILATVILGSGVGVDAKFEDLKPDITPCETASILYNSASEKRNTEEILSNLLEANDYREECLQRKGKFEIPDEVDSIDRNVFKEACRRSLELYERVPAAGIPGTEIPPQADKLLNKANNYEDLCRYKFPKKSLRKIVEKE